MKKLTLLEWRMIPWIHKGFAGSKTLQTYIVVNDERVEVQVIDDITGENISHLDGPSTNLVPEKD